MPRSLADILLESGAVTPAQLERALADRSAPGSDLGSRLVALGLIDERTLARALSQAHGFPAAETADLLNAPAEIVSLVSADFARRHRALPFRLEGDRLCLAMQDPSDTAAVHRAAFLTGYAVVPYVAAEASLRAAQARHRLLLAPASVFAAAGGTPPPEPRLALAGRRLAAAQTREDVFAAADDALGEFMPRSIVFAVRGGEAVAVHARGLDLPTSRPVSLPLGEPSVLTPAHEGRLAFGPVDLTPASRDLYTLLGGRAPRTTLVAPVVVRGRLVLVLYADDPSGQQLAPPDFERVKRLASCVACALEIVILRAKILRGSDADAADPAAQPAG